MKRLGEIFDQVWRWWTFLSGGFAALLLCFFVVAYTSQSRKDEEFVRTSLLPLASRVESFRDSQGRLPTNAEFKDWMDETHKTQAAEYYPQKPNFVSDWGKSGRDFIVGVSRGEWMHYYRSWDKKNFAGEMTPLNESMPPRR